MTELKEKYEKGDILTHAQVHNAWVFILGVIPLLAALLYYHAEVVKYQYRVDELEKKAVMLETSLGLANDRLNGYSLDIRELKVIVEGSTKGKQNVLGVSTNSAQLKPTPAPTIE